MRILYSHYLPKADQPAGHMMQAIARELRAMGHAVEIHASAGASTNASGAPAARAGQRSFSRLRARLWFAKAIARDTARWKREERAVRRFKPDVILVRQDGYCRSMTRAGHRLGIPVVTYADAPAACEARQRNDRQRWHPAGLVETIEKWGLSRSKAVVTVSEPAAEILRGYQLRVPVRAISNGIDPMRYPRWNAAERARERQRLGLTARIVVGFQGTFQGFHGIDRLRGLMQSTADREDTQWLLIGDGPERAKLERACQARNPAVFLGRQPSERMGELLGLLDIGVAPYSPAPGGFYGCPLKVLEYAAAGCATLASGQGDVPRLLDHGRAGVVVPTDDAETWEEELRGLLEDPRRREALGEYARRWIHDRFTWRHTAVQLEDVLLNAIGQPSTHRKTPRLQKTADREFRSAI